MCLENSSADPGGKLMLLFQAAARPLIGQLWVTLQSCGTSHSSPGPAMTPCDPFAAQLVGALPLIHQSST